MPPLAEVHTLNITRKISQMEVSRIRRKYQLAESDTIKVTDTGIVGINEISITKSPIFKDGAFTGYSYTLDILVNVAKVIGRSRVAMVTINHDNMYKLVGRLHEIFGGQLQLDTRNCHIEDWTLVRLDTGFDLKIPYDRLPEITLYMRLLHHSLSLENNRNCDYKRFKGYDKKNVKYESLSFGNLGYEYNIYFKRGQMILQGKKFQCIEEWDLTDGVIRFEKQMFSKKIASVLGSPQKLGLLLDEAVSQRIFSDVQADLKVFFGAGRYVAYSKGMEVIEGSRYPAEAKEYMKIVYTASTREGFQKMLSGAVALAQREGLDGERVRRDMLEARKKIEALGISVAGLFDSEVQAIQKDALANINYLMQQIKVDKEIKREKASFAKIYPENNRFRCNPTIHDADGRGHRKSLAGRSYDELEGTVAKCLYQSLKANLQTVTGDNAAAARVMRQSKEELQSFVCQVENTSIKEVVQNLIATIDTNLGGYEHD